MKAITYREAQKNLRAVIKDVCKNSEPTIIVSGKGKVHAALVSLDNYQNMKETAYLLRSPANRAHLSESLQI